MTKHTQGPWQYKRRGTQVWGRSVGGCQMIESEHLIADIRGWGHIQYLPDAEKIQDANGRLIAAAPDLLEALRFVMSAHGEQLDLAFERAHKAIAKATGETK